MKFCFLLLMIVSTEKNFDTYFNTLIKEENSVFQPANLFINWLTYRFDSGQNNKIEENHDSIPHKEYSDILITQSNRKLSQNDSDSHLVSQNNQKTYPIKRILKSKNKESNIKNNIVYDIPPVMTGEFKAYPSEMYCRYGCGNLMGITFPYYYRPFFGYGFPLIGTEQSFTNSYGGNPLTAINVPAQSFSNQF